MNPLIKISLFFLAVSFLGRSAAASDPPETVPAVDLNKYMGLWYEIARMPNSFQKQCAAGTTAEYRLLDNGRVEVINKCYRADGSLDEAHGIARVKDKHTKAKLQVSFVRFLGKNWFWGDYWVIGLDENYQWAIVGHPKRKYGWILCRMPEMEDGARLRVENLLKEKGYDPDNFIDTPMKR